MLPISFIRNNQPKIKIQEHELHAAFVAQVEAAFDPKSLERICGLTSLSFGSYAKLRELRGKDRFYYFQDNGANILAVAHLDSVQRKRHCKITGKRNGGGKDDQRVINSPVLDDRLGVYTILELLPALGIKVDWLLTTDEEYGASTADEFNLDTHDLPTDRYNWMFQFDRGGNDVVMYDYETKETVSALQSCSWRVGYGSISDISSMEHVGCVGFNFGVAYQDYHGAKAFAPVKDYVANVARFMVFHSQYAAQRWPHVETFYSSRNAWTSKPWSYTDDSENGRDYLDLVDRHYRSLNADDGYGVGFTDRPSHAYMSPEEIITDFTGAADDWFYHSENDAKAIMATWHDHNLLFDCTDNLWMTGTSSVYDRAEIIKMWVDGWLYDEQGLDADLDLGDMEDSDWRFAGWLEMMEPQARELVSYYLARQGKKGADIVEFWAKRIKRQRFIIHIKTAAQAQVDSEPYKVKDFPPAAPRKDDWIGKLADNAQAAAFAAAAISYKMPKGEDSND